MKLLLHCCCGPCSVGVVRALLMEGLDEQLTGYFYNPNIHPYQEYKARREAWKEVMAHYKLPWQIEDVYPLEEWLAAVAQMPQERCSYCYESRLRQTATKARELGFDYFSTTLLISPYQDHTGIKACGEALAAEYGLHFFYRDWRLHFKAGQQAAREMGLYMQKYCGCIYSEKERFWKQS